MNIISCAIYIIDKNNKISIKIDNKYKYKYNINANKFINDYPN